MGRPAQKRRKLNQSATEEITFDLSDRQEYLTGFHKRKVQRTKAAQEAAARKAREERIADRKKLREERKADVERHVSEVNALLRPVEAIGDPDDESDEAEVWSGLEDEALEPVDHEAEYIDEDKYTTVTVEEVDISKSGIARRHDNRPVVEEEIKPVPSPDPVKKKPPAGKKLNDRKPKKKKKTFRYESPAERKLNRLKQKTKNAKQAKARKGE